MNQDLFRQHLMVTILSTRVLVVVIKIYLYLVDFVNKIKETNIPRKIRLTLKIMLKSSKDESEIFLKIENITVTLILILLYFYW